ncbi:hypothetical protein ASD64_04980 [Mesorhizobium sp. Root157]|uniref:hypothetical protein n=1 Tax=Mesorhizobium sp. Root157 TaxID=1736477 RepID=UPI0006FACF91|nr:hypothetical protein [Mesorhizobium sp. Root157]KQZ94222.1 hypothetical protein ASD64_04980 [Mesorhizobium sp. Root157]
MNHITDNTIKILRLLPRAGCILLVLAAPVLAVPSMRDSASSTIEAPAMKKNGLGFVLLVSLQRG